MTSQPQLSTTPAKAPEAALRAGPATPGEAVDSTTDLLESALTCWHDVKSIWRTEFVSVQLFSVKPVRLISDATKQPRHRFGAGMFVIFDQKNWLDTR